ncbi:MAG: N-acetylglucosamine-6-phosphate deacetylase [Actinomycetota bacterium]|jgi:N-acetylglucosamine-6-phosphate deacetylase|nr:N-acetylglucosamine-6-phosphate deacetylase [Actinomycetota bacterium]
MNRAKGFVISAGRVATPTEILENAFVVVEGGTVREVGAGRPPAGPGELVELGDVLVAPGLVDLHVHGGGGHDVNCETPEEAEAAVREVVRYHASHGTTSLVATTVSDTHEVLASAVEGIARVARESGSGVLGTNLEGPWLSPRRAGAQYPGALRPPSLAELSDLLERAGGTLRLLTLAPELPGALEVVRAATAAGVVVSVGHTDADYATTVAAFDAGASQVTHLFNGMAPLHHRRPGPPGAALTDPRAHLEVVSDGVHLHPAVVSMVAALAPERMLFITDAIGASGSPPGRYRLGPIEVLVDENRAVLADGSGTIAGSVLTMDRAIGFAVKSAGVPLTTALRAASLTPASVLGEKEKGRLGPGADADMVVLDQDYRAVATMVAGRVVHDPGGRLGALGAGLGAR